MVSPTLHRIAGDVVQIDQRVVSVNGRAPDAHEEVLRPDTEPAEYRNPNIFPLGAKLMRTITAPSSFRKRDALILNAQTFPGWRFSSARRT
jgi:hypothetical protein